MKCTKWSAILLAGVIGISAAANAESTSSEHGDKPHHEKAETKPRTARLISPFSKLQSLTEDQENRLKEIHGRYLEQIKALQQQEKEEMMAVLSDAQKSELDEMEAAAKAARKAKAGEKREQEKKAAVEAQSDAAN